MIKKQLPSISKKASLFVGKVFSKIPLSPNRWTLLSLAFAALGFTEIYSKNLLSGTILFFVAGFMDVVDGAVARLKGKETSTGAYIDGIADRVVESMLVFALMLYAIPDFYLPGYVWLALLLFFGSAMTSFAKAYADHKKTISDDDLDKMGGILERPERYMIVIFGMVLGLWDAANITYAVALAAVLSIITFLQRVSYTIKKAEKSDKND